jgi:hypothetical protein
VSPPFTVLRGHAPVVLVAPHGGRRDPVARPWGSAPLKMNDLHTPAVTRELAARLGASALINESADRNDVDLNRISAAHDAAPEFLAALADLIEHGLARHETIGLLTVHGWNVVQPAVDVGLGVHPSAETLGGAGGAGMSAQFATGVLARLATRLQASGIAATPGLRYPARARENLIQLFTGRHDGDRRAAVRRLATASARVNAAQLELSLPLRMPGPWRDAFVAACADVFGEEAASGTWPEWNGGPVDAGARVAVELVAPGLSVLAAIDERGARLLLFPDDGRLLTFTSERVGPHAPDRIAGLRLRATPAGTVELAYDGPMLRFPDTTPFVDLERGLASAVPVAATVAIELTPSHRDADGPCPFGTVSGHAQIGDVRYEIRGHGVRVRREVDLGVQTRVALRLADGTGVLSDGRDGFVCREGAHAPIRRCHVEPDGAHARVEINTADGPRIETTATVLHRLPVVPGVPGAPRLLFAACRHADALAGWIQTRSDHQRPIVR